MATIVKHIKIGTPVRRVSADIPDVTTANVTDFDVTNKALGDILVYDSATGKYTSTGIIGSNGITVSYSAGDSNVDIGLSASGAAAGSYGNLARIPVISVNEQGLIDSIGEVTVSVAGGNAITDIDFDSSTGILTVTTGDGSYTTEINLGASTTTDLLEGDNLYYTQARVDSDVRNGISVVDSGGFGSLSYDNTNGVISFSGPSASDIRSNFSNGTGISIVDGQINIDSTASLVVDGITATAFETTDSGLRVYGNLLPGTDSSHDLGSPDNKWRSLYVSGNTIYLGTITLEDEGGEFVVRTAGGEVAPINFAGTTSTITEGANLYYTQARFDSAFSDKTTTDLVEGTNKYYTLARFDSAFNLRFNAKLTTNLPEGTNLYYTDARVTNLVDTAYVQARQTTYDLSPYASITYVDAEIANLVDAAPGTLNTLNELAAALGDNPNFATTVTNSIASKLAITDFSSYFNSTLAGKSTTDLTEGSNLYYTNARVGAYIDSAYIQARVAPVDVVDSAAIISIATNLVDAAYVQARQTTYDFLDSAEVIALVDSDYVQARVAPVDVVDSAAILTLAGGLVDSAYVQARQTAQDFAYSSLTGTPSILDSNDVTGIIDSAYVNARINTDLSLTSIALDSNIPGDTTNKLYQQDGTLYWNGASLQDSAILGYVALNKAGDTMTGDLTINKVSPRIFFNDADDGSVEVAIGVYGEDFYIYEPEDPNGTQVPAPMGIGRQWLSILDTQQRVNAFGYQVWTAGNDGSLSGLDADLLDGQQGNYYTNFNNLTNVPDYLTQDSIIDLVDSAYVQLRQLVTGELVGLDSANVQNIIDSDHVQARQDYSYSSLTDIPDLVDSADVAIIITDTVDANYINARVSIGVDSAAIVSIVDSDYVRARSPAVDEATVLAITIGLVDSDYVQARQTASGVDSAATIALIDSDYVQARQDPGFDSTDITGIITSVVDAAYVQNRQETYDFLDSAEVIALIDSAYVQARETYSTANQLFDAIKTLDSNGSGLNADTLDGQQGSYYTNYNNLTNRPNVLDSGHVSNIIIANVDSAYVQARETPQDFAYSSLTGAPNVLDSNNVKNIFSAGTGVTYNDGEFSIGQPVGTTDSVTFSGLTISGNLIVNGTTTTVSQQTLSVSSSLIHLAESNETSDIVDIGFIGHYSNDGGSTKRHTGFFRDANNSEYYLFDNLIDSALDSVSPSQIIEVGGTGWELATINVGTIKGQYAGFDSDFNDKSTDDLAEGTNLYYTTTRFDSDLSDKTTDDVTEGSNLYYTDGRFDTRLATKSTDNLTEGSNLYYTDARFDSALSTKSTDDVTEGANLYYTDGRFDTRLATKSTDDVTEGANLYYTTIRFDSDLSVKTTDDLTEGANLYYTDVRVTTLIDSAYIQSRQNLVDSASIIALVDSSYVQARQDYAYASLTDAPNVLDSVNVSNIILNDVDSSYVQARQDYAYASLTGAPNVLDSGHVSNIILADVDGTYIGNRVDIDYIASQIDIGGVGFANYVYEATADQTSFSDSDIKGNPLSYVARKVEVYRNGILLVDSDQYTSTSGNAIVLTTGADSGDVISISAYTATNGFFNGRDSGDGMVITGDLDVRGTALLRSSTEEIQLLNGATGVVSHDFSLGSTFYHTNVASDFTVNITNAPTYQNRAFTVALLIQQTGSGPYIPSALQINGSAQTIKWAEDTEPLGYLNNLDLVSFTVLNINGTYTVMGQMITYG